MPRIHGKIGFKKNGLHMTEYEEELLDTIETLRAELLEAQAEANTLSYQLSDYEADLEYAREELSRLEDHYASLREGLLEDIENQRQYYEDRISQMEDDHYNELLQERESAEERLQQEREYLEEQYRRDDY